MDKTLTVAGQHPPPRTPVGSPRLQADVGKKTGDRHIATPTHDPFAALPLRDGAAPASHAGFGPSTTETPLPPAPQPPKSWRRKLRDLLLPAVPAQRPAPDFFPVVRFHAPISVDPLLPRVRAFMARPGVAADIREIQHAVDHAPMPPSAGALAQRLAVLYDDWSGAGLVAPGQQARLMPLVIEAMLADGTIDMQRATLAKTAADRVGAYAGLLQAMPTPAASGLRIYAEGLLRASIDTRAFESLLDAPARWVEMMPRGHETGVMAARSRDALKTELEWLAVDMAGDGYLHAPLLAKLRGLIPAIADACERHAREHHGGPAHPPTQAVKRRAPLAPHLRG